MGIAGWISTSTDYTDADTDIPDVVDANTGTDDVVVLDPEVDTPVPTTRLDTAVPTQPVRVEPVQHDCSADTAVPTRPARADRVPYHRLLRPTQPQFAPPVWLLAAYGQKGKGKGQKGMGQKGNDKGKGKTGLVRSRFGHR